MTITAPSQAPPRLGALLDPGSFQPIRTQVLSTRVRDPKPGDGVVGGSGRVDGREVFCYEQDASVLGGSLGEVHAASMCRILDLADRYGRPVVGVHRSGGARIQEGVGALAGYAAMFRRHVALRDRVPQIALVFGPCAGGAAYGPALMDFVAMPSDGAYMFLTGPDVVRQVTGEETDFQGLGGADVHGRSGLASLVGRDDSETLDLTRELLSYLPSRVGDVAPASTWTCEGDGTDPGSHVPDEPRQTYDVRRVVRAVADDARFLEVHGGFAPNLVCGFTRIEGRVAGVVANQPQSLGGTIDIAASRKGARFVSTCDRFRIPLVVLVDTPGFLPGRGQELGGVICHGAGFLAAFSSATVPKVTVVLRKAYGGAYIVMNARDLGADYVFAWPGAEIAVMGARGAVSILERRRLAEADDPAALRTELEAEYRDRYCTPWPAAEAGFVDEVISPRETRARIAGGLSR